MNHSQPLTRSWPAFHPSVKAVTRILVFAAYELIAAEFDKEKYDCVCLSVCTSVKTSLHWHVGSL